MAEQKTIGEKDERINELKNLKLKVDSYWDKGAKLRREVESFLKEGAELSDDIDIRLKEYENEEEMTIKELKETVIELAKVVELKTNTNLTQLIRKLKPKPQ